MGRAILALVAGCVVSVLVIFGMDAISHLVYPPPMEAARDPYRPTGAFIIVVAGWILGAGLGAWVATRLSSGKAWTGGAVGGVTLAATGINLLNIAHPLWVVLVAIIGILLATWSGIRAARTPPATAPTAHVAGRHEHSS